MTNPKCTRARVSWFILATIAIALFAYGRSALAGGFFLDELGAPDLGLASAGYAARAQDASTVFTNPAGSFFYVYSLNSRLKFGFVESVARDLPKSLRL
jgi:hypothetical protein